MALSMLLRGMNEVVEGEKLPWCDARGDAVVPHGFRSTFRDWCEEATSTPHAVCEAALAHAVADKVEAAYRRSDLFEKRTALMTSWAEQCERMPAKVVTMDSRKPQAVAVAAG
jgi:integrase